ncbi:MAG: oxidoreductase [Comamonadaceae bacterium]|nr:MAG: oxidoreductase [Comamonadaceae bacterium]
MTEPATAPTGTTGPTPSISVAALQEQAAAAGLALRPPPTEPTTCCGRGCNGCVWEGYWSALDWWREETLDLLGKQRLEGSNGNKAGTGKAS